jgi:hypothetical protein
MRKSGTGSNGHTYYIHIYIYVCVCVCVCVRATFIKSFTALSASGPRTPFECTGEYSVTARRAAVTRMRGGANLNCTFKIWSIFSHPCTAYRQLKFFIQPLLDGLCKRTKFQVRFRPDKPDHSLVSVRDTSVHVMFCADVNLLGENIDTRILEEKC